MEGLLKLLKPGGVIQWVESDFLGCRGRRSRDGGEVFTSSSSGPGVTGFETGKAGLAPLVPGSGAILTHAQLQFNGSLYKRMRFNFPDFEQLFVGAGLERVVVDVVSNDRIPEIRPAITGVGIGAVFGGLKMLSSVKGDGFWDEETVEKWKDAAIADMEGGAYLRWDMYVAVGWKKE